MKILQALGVTLALFAAFPVGAADLAKPAVAASAAAQKYRVVIQVSDPDPRLWAQAINYTENLRQLLGKDNVETEIVALGLGIGILKLESPHAARVADSLKAGVKFSACESTMTRQKLTKGDMLPDIGYTPGGLVRIIERQREGWNYIKG
jgi:intracellular sulfur oxidation DsrE/DsrF family protein